MKKMCKEDLIKILRNKSSDISYKELSIMTGYHPKSLIRINSQLKKGNYSMVRKKDQIIKDYLSKEYKSYKDFYLDIRNKYNISYSWICKILKNIACDTEVVLVRKLRREDKTEFVINDYQSGLVLFTQNSLKNDTKSLKQILYKIIGDYGTPKSICFTNIHNVSKDIMNILSKYNIRSINYSSVFYTKASSCGSKPIIYKDCYVNKTDFYNSIERKLTQDNTLQFNNRRYIINTEKFLAKKTLVKLYYDEEKRDIFITVNNKQYTLTEYKKLVSKKGLTKY